MVNCAKQYSDILDGRVLLFICLDKHKAITTFECSFMPGNFLHITGLKVQETGNGNHTSTGAVDFYHKCLDHKLSPQDFEFAAGGITALKLNVLPGIINKSLKARMIGDYNSSHPSLYTDKLAGSIQACMGFVRERRTGVFVPNTVLKEDIQERTSGYARVIAVYRRKMTEERYVEMTYAAKGLDWARVRLPKEIGYIELPYDH